MKILVLGAGSLDDVPDIQDISDRIKLVFAPDQEALERELPGVEVMFIWKLKGISLESCWHLAHNLKWIHIAFAGVDALLFDELRESDVVLTNARGIFDRAMAEFVLGYMLLEAKDLATTLDDQKNHFWNYRLNHKLAGDAALVFGVGSIGREVARVLSAMGLKVSGVGRSERRTDPDFEHVYAPLDINEEIVAAQWIIGVMPATPSTEGYFNADFFSRMNPNARFINIGRGQAVIESDLVAAIRDGQIAGAMLDVFESEPLDSSSELWDVDNLFISPHNCGDFEGFESDIVKQFVSHFQNYASGRMFDHVVDKELGFVASHDDGDDVA